MSTRVSGLSDAHAAEVRKGLVHCAQVMVANKNSINYSQGGDRMVGVRSHLTIRRGQFPHTCDCSSTAYWMLFDWLFEKNGVRDLVCEAHWNPNATIYTGTMYRHGKRVVHDSNLKIGDLIFYGDQGGGVPEHVAMYIGGGYVFSHGSMGGPYILKMDYRDDRRHECMMRFI